jgi:hypothetical protein
MLCHAKAAASTESSLFYSTLQVGYMGVPYNGSDMAQHPQYITVRNARGREMLDCLGAELQRTPAMSKGDGRPLVMQVGVTLCCSADTMVSCNTGS